MADATTTTAPASALAIKLPCKHCPNKAVMRMDDRDRKTLGRRVRVLCLVCYKTSVYLPDVEAAEAKAKEAAAAEAAAKAKADAAKAAVEEARRDAEAIGAAEAAAKGDEGSLTPVSDPALEPVGQQGQPAAPAESNGKHRKPKRQ